MAARIDSILIDADSIAYKAVLSVLDRQVFAVHGEDKDRLATEQVESVSEAKNLYKDSLLQTFQVYADNTSNEEQPELALNFMKSQFNKAISDIREELGEDLHYLIYVEDPKAKSFRHTNPLYSDYKAQRKTDPLVKEYINKVKEYIKTKYSDCCVMSKDIESDDAVSIEAYSRKVGTCWIAHIDKDLDMIAGRHYNYDICQRYKVTHSEAEYNLMYQLLVGDTCDNIKGCPGIGDKKARTVLDGVKEKDTNSYVKVIINEYLKAYSKAGMTPTTSLYGACVMMTKNLNLLYLKRSKDIDYYHKNIEDSILWYSVSDKGAE